MRDRFASSGGRVINGRRSAGFTLVELLVVIGIIALLISILLPALSRARESGNRVKCLANLRQLTFAWMSYANDNKGWMPGAGTATTDPTTGLAYSWIGRRGAGAGHPSFVIVGVTHPREGE